MAPIAIALSSRLTSLTRHLPSSSSISIIPRGANLLARQNDPSIIPSTYGSINSGPAPGTVVGIVLGSVGGFLLILWLIYTCLNFGRLGETSSSYTESVHVAAARRQSHGSQRSRRTETVEIRRERSPIRVVREEPSRVVREERSRRGWRGLLLRRNGGRLGGREVVAIAMRLLLLRSTPRHGDRRVRKSAGPVWLKSGIVDSGLWTRLLMEVWLGVGRVVDGSLRSVGF